MQNLFQLILRYGVFLVFLFLQIIGLVLVVKYNKSQREIFINSSNLVSGWMNNKAQHVIQYIRIGDIADSLAAENARLRTDLELLRSKSSLRRDTIRDSIYKQEYAFISAKVVNNSTQVWENKITINKGESHGISKGMGIINDKGIVGVVHNTSANFAQALSILHSQLRISASHKKSGHFGTLVWSSINPEIIILKDIHVSSEVQLGDTIVTNRYSSIFPEGIMVGTIQDFTIERGTKIYRIEVKLNQDMSKLDHVYVVNYLFKEEQVQVESLK